MPLSQRPYSINTYALSKIWFRSASVNLREMDFKSINSSIKQWLYADVLLKPEEFVLFRQVDDGGLGLTSVKHKALAMLIRNFIDLAYNPKYLNSLFLNLIYKKHVLGEDITCPAIPPYFKECDSFFETIRNAKDDGRDIINMSTKDWYKYILNIKLFSRVTDDGENTPVLCRIERNKPELNFPEIWSFVRMPSLPSKTTSFLWSLAHELLPSDGRLAAIKFRNTSPYCKKDCVSDTLADYEHCFFRCSHSKEVGDWLLRKIRMYSSSDANPTSVLEFKHLDNVACSWVTAMTLHYIWVKRMEGGRTSIGELVMQLQRSLDVMENTKFHDLFVIDTFFIQTRVINSKIFHEPL